MNDFYFDDYLSNHISDDQRRRRYVQNSVIVDVAVELNRALRQCDMSQRDLAARLGKSEGFVSQVLSGGSNMTLKTLGDFLWGLDCELEVVLRPHHRFAECVVPTWHSPEIQATKAADTELSLAA